MQGRRHEFEDRGEGGGGVNGLELGGGVNTLKTLKFEKGRGA